MVRPAVKADLPLIAQFIRDLAAYENMVDDLYLEDKNLEEHLFGDRPYAEVLIAEEDGIPVGFALFFHTYISFSGRPGLFIEDLFVKPEYRANGHGSNLLSHIAKICIERDCEQMDWEAMRPNIEAQEFYRSLGCEQTDAEFVTFKLAGERLHEMAAQATTLKEQTAN